MRTMSIIYGRDIGMCDAAWLPLDAVGADAFC